MFAFISSFFLKIYDFLTCHVIILFFVTSPQLRSRTEASEVKETAMRNEYVLSLAAANAHHIRYYSTDLPDLMKVTNQNVII